MDSKSCIDNYKLWKIVLDIYLSDIKKDVTLNELCIKINISRTHPYLFKVLDILISNNAIKVNYSIGGLKLLKIDYDKIEKMIEESKIYTENLAFISKKSPLAAELI